MIDIGSAIPATLARLKKLPVGNSLELLTYKRDRGLRIGRTGDNAFRVREFGFRTEVFEVDLESMKKLLKTLLKREFPRSNKVRVQESGS
ncbi:MULTISPECIES: hypothetical protein [unclassified Pseudodesulfovibrio]|uniref:hypothetical protein n=1 Tax=unclassified Pseudodesulfovibrio TaxID=2661612 RepID=UPI000FEC0BCB|nr:MULTISPECIES: hypothetical protein [unclassified Pseudodesulfovibrio]MCJ2164888.1 hypothetical protein [Pseudodesulfovibrio sp. S3-i]RWU03745.1 hypothetical protein DWB63_09815 [Pseudodesulfovibrio sp. S3]